MTTKEMCNTCKKVSFCASAYQKDHWCGAREEKDVERLTFLDNGKYRSSEKYTALRDHLGVYEDLEEQGRIIRHDLMPGDVIWFYVADDNFERPKLKRSKIQDVSLKGKVKIEGIAKLIDIGGLGRVFFRTRKEAESAPKDKYGFARVRFVEKARRGIPEFLCCICISCFLCWLLFHNII